MPANDIYYANPHFLKACDKIKKEREDFEDILDAAVVALEELRSYVRESDWVSQHILSSLVKRSDSLFNLGINYESFLISLKRQSTKNNNSPFLITPLTLGPVEG